MLGRDGLKIVVGLWICFAVPMLLLKVPTDATVPLMILQLKLVIFKGFYPFLFFSNFYFYPPSPPPSRVKRDGKLHIKVPWPYAYVGWLVRWSATKLKS